MSRRRRGAPWVAPVPSEISSHGDRACRPPSDRSSVLGESALSFVERHGLWSAEQKDAAVRLRRIVEEQQARSDPAVVSGPARHPARQDADRGRGAALPGERLHHYDDDVRQGHLASHRVSGVHRRRRIWPCGNAGRRRRPDDSGSLDLPCSAVGVGQRAGCCATFISPTAGRCRSPPAISTRPCLPSLASRGYDFMAGLEVEFHVFKLDDARMAPADAGQPGQPPDVSLLSHGYQYLTEQRYDQMEPVLELIRRDVLALGLPLRSVEVEFGPSQCEFTFQPTVGLVPADSMVLFRSAVKQICHRHGYHATFMCRPRIPNVVSSGWHLHQSIVSRATGENAFMTTDPRETLSAFGRGYLAGLLAARPRRHRVHHADHQRLQALSLLFAGAGSRDLGTRQPRRDDPRARRSQRYRDPVWKTASASRPPIPTSTWPRKFSPGSTASIARSIPVLRADTPYETNAELLPKSLREAVFALKDDPFFRNTMGATWSTTTCASRMPKSSVFRRKSPNGSSASISRCSELPYACLRHVY